MTRARRRSVVAPDRVVPSALDDVRAFVMRWAFATVLRPWPWLSTAIAPRHDVLPDASVAPAMLRTSKNDQLRLLTVHFTKCRELAPQSILRRGADSQIKPERSHRPALPWHSLTVLNTLEPKRWARHSAAISNTSAPRILI